MIFIKRLLYTLLGIFLFLFETIGQEKVDITTCDASNSGVICVSPTDTLYEVCVKLKPGPSPEKTYKISWGDGKAEEIKLNAETTTRHIYDLKSFLKDCNDPELERSISIKNTNPDNANDNKGFILTFNKKPQANLIVKEACEGSAIRFENNSCPSSGNVSYLWEFSDGRKSTDYTPNISFTDPNQTYSVKLTATSRNCGVNTKEASFKMSKLPVASYKADGYTVSNTDTVVCMSNGGILSLDGTISTDESYYEWKISGGSYSYLEGHPGSGKIKIKFNDSKEYTITLIARNVCGNSKPFICKHRVVSEPQLGISPQNDDCEPIKYKLANPNSQATYTFNGNPLGLNEIKEAGYSDTPYIIGATLKYECGVKIAKPDTFFVRQKQAVKITSFRDTTLCVGANAVDILATPNGGNWTGKFIENQKMFNPKEIGIYEIKYSLGVGKCATRDSVKINVQGINIVANDEAICQGLTKLPLKATPGGGTWSTNVCSGCIKNDTLNTVGLNNSDFKLTYSVTTSIGGGKSCSAKKDINVKIGRPLADFDVSGGCSGASSQILNKSTGASAYEWYLNNETSPFSTIQSPSFSLPKGNASVKLVAFAGACHDTTTKKITVSVPPEPFDINLDKTIGCSPLPVTFSINTTERNDLAYHWDFGDGNTSDGYKPSPYIFNNQTTKDKEFTVEVTLKNTCGEEKKTKKVTVRPLAKAEIGVDSTIFRCSPARVKFSNRSSGNLGTSSWVFDNEAPFFSASDTLSHIFSAKDSVKSYQVSLIVSNSCGNDTSKVAITVFPENVKPLFTMSTITACAGEPVLFKDATVPKPERWLWKFGNEDKAITPNPTYSFKDANRSYNVTLIAYTACGYDSIQRSIKTTAPPEVSFKLSNQFLCQDEPMKVINTSGPLYSFVWDFGDNSPHDSINYSPIHSYKIEGPKTVKLIGYGNTSKTCKNEYPVNINVRKKPTADFKIATAGDILCSNQLIRFENLSKDATKYKWYFKDGHTLNAANPEVNLNAGFHDVSLVAYYENNTCKDSVYRDNYIEVDTCQIEIPEVFTPNNDNIGDFFTAFGSKGLKKILLLRIRNRWGEIIFEKKDFEPNILTEGWDGKVNNLNMPEGAYVYEIEAEFIGNIKKQFKNNFSLVR
ncbi:PKD domain-containing protein [Emticicia sp. TH156]|uniref:PKD domain-containing protein n=1 Tax=Emticicia sp. TH156 TaxID=2067454 RepID=UPI000C764AFE|nr:PKD domain-containing protein [Emticicia sp. TH156]PLK42430.1 hypothetical protein C0V77_20665 [Emticicia sp. TH156]